MDLPGTPPFVLRARLLTPLDDGGFRHEPDARIEVDAEGRITAVGAWSDDASAADADDASAADAIDLRPWVVLPGMVDLHAHLPQILNAGLGAGTPLLPWLEKYIFPLERDFDREMAGRVAPAAWQAFAAAGTTCVLAYGAVYQASLDEMFRAAEAHGIRAVIGKVMMDRITYDPTIAPSTIIDRTIAESGWLIDRWHGVDRGRLRYAVTPRFAVSCTAELLRESASLAASTGAYWQTHVSEDHGEIAEVARLFPEAIDYVDVYERAGGLGARTVLAHAVYLSDRELGRLVDTGTHVAHCPISNLFLASGVMPLGRYRDAGLSMGLGSDIAGGPDLSIFSVMRVGFYAQHARQTAGLEHGAVLGPLEWLRLGSLAGAQALGMGDEIGSIEVGKDADLIAVDPAFVAPIPGIVDDDPEDLASRLIFRAHPDMVRAAWVRGQRLEGPGGRG